MIAGGQEVDTCPDPESMRTDEERREAIRQSYRKYYNTHRVAIRARRAKAYKRKRAAIQGGAEGDRGRSCRGGT